MDIGIYCINASRYLFRDEPTEVIGMATKGPDPRFAEVDESISAVLKFPGGRLATFTVSFGAASVSSYRVVGTKGDLVMDPAYGFEGELKSVLTVEGKSKAHTFKQHDQFGRSSSTSPTASSKVATPSLPAWKGWPTSAS